MSHAAEYYREYMARPGVKDRVRAYLKEYNKTYRLRPEQKRARKANHLKKEYGITIESFDSLFLLQRGRCAICERHQDELKQPLCVDHNHETKKIRGLLCHQCNAQLLVAIERYRHLIPKALVYLEAACH